MGMHVWFLCIPRHVGVVGNKLAYKYSTSLHSRPEGGGNAQKGFANRRKK